MTDSFIDDAEIIAELGFADRCALAYFTAAQILLNAQPSRESVPLLSEQEHAILVDRIRGIAADMREAAGDRGPTIWALAQ